MGWMFAPPSVHRAPGFPFVGKSLSNGDQARTPGTRLSFGGAKIGRGRIEEELMA